MRDMAGMVLWGYRVIDALHAWSNTLRSYGYGSVGDTWCKAESGYENYRVGRRYELRSYEKNDAHS